MGSKKASKLEMPPSPESSGTDDEPLHTPLQTPSKNPDSDSEPETEEDEEEEEDPEEDEDDVPEAETPAVPQKKLPLPVPEPESESESESDPDESPSTKVSNYTIKPIVKEKAEKVEKPTTKGSSKAGKTKPEDEHEEKKGMVNRIWNHNDEIAILQGLIDFRKENNKDPSSNYDEFVSFIKGRLTDGKFSRVQVKDKVNRLKRKYREFMNKSNGKDPEFSNSHDLKCFQLSKRMWGPSETNVNTNVRSAGTAANVESALANKNVTVVGIPASNGKVKTSGGKSAKKRKIVVEKIEKVDKAEKVAPAEDDMMEVDDEKVEKVEKIVKVGKGEDLGRLYPHLVKAFEGDTLPKVPIFDEMRHCLSNADSLQLEEWDRKWKKIRLAEMDAYISKLALVQEQTSWVLNAMKSSK